VTDSQLSDAGDGSVRVEKVEAPRTYLLRQQVLRPNLTVDQMMDVFGDTGPDTAIFGAIDASGELVGTGNVRREEPPEGLAETAGIAAEDAAHPWRLRGMATREDLRSQGIGRQVLDACVAHVARHGGGLLWCNARLVARMFYVRAGFVEWGEEFVSQSVAHVVMWRTVPVGDHPGQEEGES